MRNVALNVDAMQLVFSDLTVYLIINTFMYYFDESCSDQKEGLSDSYIII